MTDRQAPALAKWPFILGDLLLLGAATWIALQPGNTPDLWVRVLVTVAVGIGAWLFVTPFILEHRAAADLNEMISIEEAVGRINNIDAVAAQISGATSQWQEVQVGAAQTANLAREIATQMTTEARNFTEFLQKANDSEKASLRLEVEKMRRGEAEWLQVLVRVLDHIFVLHKAGLASGQQNLIEQLNAFQHACRDSARRIGLLPFVATPGEPYNQQAHQSNDGAEHESGIVHEVIAPGYTFQGQLIRKSLVLLESQIAAQQGAATPEAQPEPTPHEADLTQSATGHESEDAEKAAAQEKQNELF